MAQEVQERRIDQFFSGPGARADEWRGLVDAAKTWSSGSVIAAVSRRNFLSSRSPKNFMPILARA